MGKKFIGFFSRYIFLIYSPLFILLFLSGCSYLGPDFMEGNRNEYNKVLANTNDEEVLLNLVRRRYADSIAILEVNSVSTSLEWKKSTGISAKLFDGDLDDNNLGLAGDGSYSEKPTITYLPLDGADYVKNILTPVDLETILLLTRSGWAADRVFRLTVNNINGINNASEASGPTPGSAPKYKKFLQVANTLKKLQQEDSFTLGYRLEDDSNKFGFLIKPSQRNNEEVKRFLNLIKINTTDNIIPITANYRGQANREVIEINLRSLAGIQFFLSHGIIIPKEDLDQGRVQITKNNSGEIFDWNNVLSGLFTVYSSKDKPDSASVSVQYRGNWFYIKDNDMQSKYTLMLLNQISALQSGVIEKVGPVLTIPVSQ
tara:strand:- start:92 stop:1210 length:1119 start_codon:yes stop_codon:yes gene_type:complete